MVEMALFDNLEDARKQLKKKLDRRQRRRPAPGTELQDIKMDFLPAAELHGSAVGISAKGIIRVRWRQDKQNYAVVIFNVMYAAPTEGEGEGAASRTIGFTKHGVDILDSDGNPFRTHYANTGKISKSTIPKVQLAGGENGKLAFDLWRVVRIANGHIDDIIPAASTNIKEWKVEPGLKALARNATTE